MNKCYKASVAFRRKVTAVNRLRRKKAAGVIRQKLAALAALPRPLSGFYGMSPPAARSRAARRRTASATAS